MADELVGTYVPPKYAIHEAGSFAGVVCDFINLGYRVREDKKTKKPYVVGSIAYTFYCGETDPENGRPMYLSREFDVHLSDNANLRKFLEGMRGAKYTPDDLQAGIPFHKAVGRGYTITVVHNESKGKTYANIESAKPLAKGLTAPAIPADFARADFWQKSKDKYAAEVAAYEARYGTREDVTGQSEKEETPF